jgi:hypothetical protein
MLAIWRALVECSQYLENRSRFLIETTQLRGRYATLERQPLDIAQAQTKTMVPAYRAADGRCRKTKTVITQPFSSSSAQPST